jgi:hypothetical protein
MEAVMNRDRWLKRGNSFVIKVMLVLLLVLAGHDATADHTIKLSKVGDSLDGHSTTRTTVRRVFHHDGHWYVFCGDVHNGVYHNFFVSSTDGIHWSDRKVGSGGAIAGNEIGAPNLPETAILYRDQIYGCYSEQGEFAIGGSARR